MYTSFGELSPSTLAAAKAALPKCYDALTDYCMSDSHRFQPECKPFEPVHKAYAEDLQATQKLIDDWPECQFSARHMVMAVGGGLLAGAIIGAVLL